VTTGGRQNVTIAAGTGTPPTVSGVAASYWVTTRITETLPQSFSAVLGNRIGTVSARATAIVAADLAHGVSEAGPRAPRGLS
jgi:hypothetical protein